MGAYKYPTDTDKKEKKASVPYVDTELYQVAKRPRKE